MASRHLLLVAVHDRPSFERTLTYVSQICSGRTDVEIQLVQVLPGEGADPNPSREPAKHGHAEAPAAESLGAVLATARARLVAQGVVAESIGTPTILRSPHRDLAELFVEHAKHVGAETLVVGWDTYSFLMRWLHRHVGEHLAARERDVSLWVVRRQRSPSDESSVLLALDDSEASADAVDYVGRILAGRRGAKVHLFSVLEPIAPSSSDYEGDRDAVSVEEMLDDAARRRLQRARAQTTTMLEAARARLLETGRDAGSVTVECSAVFATVRDIPEAIARAAHSRSCATVVVGRHAMTWAERLFERHVGAELLDVTGDLTVWIAA